jgi:hypothetical protein
MSLLKLKVCIKNIIKKTAVIILLVMTSFSSKAQNAETLEIYVPERHGSATELIESIQEQSGYVISYSSRLCIDTEVTLSSSKNTLIGF